MRGRGGIAASRKLQRWWRGCPSTAISDDFFVSGRDGRRMSAAPLASALNNVVAGGEFSNRSQMFHLVARYKGTNPLMKLRDYQSFRHDSSQRTLGLKLRSFGSASIKVPRSTTFSKINTEDICHFRAILGEKNAIQDEDRLSAANSDWMKKYRGSSQLLLTPGSTEEVSQILQYCDSRQIAVVPQGGNTSLVGGSVPVHDEVVINISRMNKIISFDPVNLYDSQCGFIMPLDLGAKGSCQIGGNVSTNAGGLRFLRYGSLHGNILGLEVVLANGSVIDMLSTLRKDNTGYDLKQLFIGSEGTLGIITKVSVLTPPLLASTNLVFLGCRDYLSCQKLLMEGRKALGEIISAFEFMDCASMEMVLNHLEGVRNPFSSSMYDFYVLIETTGSDESSDKLKLETFLGKSMEKGLIDDGVIAQDMSQTLSFWRLREGITEALVKAGAVYKYDLSIPIQKLYDIVEAMRTRLGHSAKVLGYGHLGDSNLHLNISTAAYDDEVLSKIEPFVYEWTAANRGSISAEHGLGVMKADKIYYSKTPEAVNLMAAVKRLLDPKGILNPYKVLPSSLVLPN
ncbi:FAD-linked oxidases family protein isoform X2 [Wolffia australiana]